MRPVFIGGVDRSGTTLLGSLLASIPGAAVTPESLFKTTIKRSNYKNGDEYGQALQSSFRFSAWKTKVEQIPASDSDRTALESLVRSYAGTECNFWVDHSPNNLDHIVYLKRVFPEARFLHIIRDGRAVASSVIPLEWGPNTAVSSAKFWIDRLSYCFAAQCLYPEDVKIVYLEELVANPVDVLNTIMEFLQVNHKLISEKDIKIATGLVPSGTQAQHEKVGHMPDATVIDKWKKTLSHKQIRDFEFYAGPMLEMLGYPLLSTRQRPSKLHLVMDVIQDLYRKKINNPHKFRQKRNIA